MGFEVRLLAPFDLNPIRVFSLSPDRFTVFCNDLVRAEAGRIALAQSLVDDTVRHSDPDGGIDCRVNAPGHDGPENWGDWVPEGGSAWQYKSGACPSANELAREEFRKTEVLNAIDRGDTYCFLTAQSISARKKNQILAVVEALYRERGLEPKARVYTGTHLAAWAKQHLAPVTKHLGVPVGGWWPFEMWERSARLRNEFFADEARTELITGIRRRIREGGSPISVLGRAGVGKTRTVMEAVRGDGLKQRVLYLPDASFLTPDFFWHLHHEVPNATAILVIDECTPAEHQRVTDLSGGLPEDVTVILVGPQDYVAHSDFQLGTLSVRELAEIVGYFAPGLPEDQKRAIASRCGGFPKLVVYVSEEIARLGGEITSWEELERAGDVVRFLNERLFPIHGSDTDSKVMRALSLFSRLGWRHEVEFEGQAATRLLGVEDWTEAQLAAGRLIERGVVSRRGRYLYPTPDILADYLARDTLDNLGSNRLREFFDVLSEDARTSMAERLRHLGDESRMRESVTAIVGDPDFFLRTSDLNETGRTRLLRLLAPAFPRLALGILERTVGTASREELLDLTNGGRREVVQLLDDLAWWRDHFHTAARLLLRLARAENEKYVNNATGIWARLFQVLLSGTETPFNERFTLLQEVLSDPDASFRQLGLVGLSSALTIGQVSRVGTAPEDTGHLPPEEWQPATHGEWRRIIEKCMAELEKFLDDPADEVREQAMTILRERATDLINAGYLNEWASLARRLTGESFEARKGLLSAVGWYLRHRTNLASEDRATLEALASELRGRSFSDRLRRIVGTWDFELEDLEKDGEATRTELVAFALRNRDQLEPELGWLFGGDAHSAFTFGKELGEADTENTLLHTLVDYWVPRVPDDRLLTGYLAGIAEREGREWLEELLDEWVADPAKDPLVAVTTWRVLPTVRAARRLQRLLEAGRLEARYLENLVLGFWARELLPEHVRDLVTAAADDTARGANARLAFVEQYISQYPESLGTLRDVAWEALEQSARLQHLDTMASYRWRRLAETVSAEDPVEMARLSILGTQATGYGYLDEETRQVLFTALDKATTEQKARILEEVLGPAFDSVSGLLWGFDDPFDKKLLDQFDPDQVLNWAEQDLEQRLIRLAHATPVRGQPLAGLARALLVRHGERQDVREALAASFGTGGWTGSESEWIAGKARQLERWAQDSHPNVRRWAVEMQDYYQARFERTRLLEEEGPY